MELNLDKGPIIYNAELLDEVYLVIAGLMEGDTPRNITGEACNRWLNLKRFLVDAIPK